MDSPLDPSDQEVQAALDGSAVNEAVNVEGIDRLPVGSSGAVAG